MKSSSCVSASADMQAIIDAFIAHPPAGRSRQELKDAQAEIYQKLRLLQQLPSELLQDAVPLVRESLMQVDSPRAAVMLLSSLHRTLLGTLFVQALPESCRTLEDVERLCELARAGAALPPGWQTPGGARYLCTMANIASCILGKLCAFYLLPKDLRTFHILGESLWEFLRLPQLKYGKFNFGENLGSPEHRKINPDNLCPADYFHEFADYRNLALCSQPSRPCDRVSR